VIDKKIKNEENGEERTDIQVEPDHPPPPKKKVVDAINKYKKNIPFDYLLTKLNQM
jgi:hypothetical protein